MMIKFVMENALVPHQVNYEIFQMQKDNCLTDYFQTIRSQSYIYCKIFAALIFSGQVPSENIEYLSNSTPQQINPSQVNRTTGIIFVRWVDNSTVIELQHVMVYNLSQISKAIQNKKKFCSSSATKSYSEIQCFHKCN